MTLGPGPALVWYVSYGSNMCAGRLAAYLQGGRPPGASRTYPGARDRQPPRADVAVWLPGGIYFAGQSSVWTGGTASYDPSLPGRAPARAYLLTLGQFSDVAAQEMHAAPGADLDLAEVLAAGRAGVGPGRYQTLLCAGNRGGYPLLTFTCPTALAAAETTRPAAAYLRMLAAGLAEAHGWSMAQIVGYLFALPGVVGGWTPEMLESACSGLGAPGRLAAAGGS
ncbi:MAG: histone deacetylase [Dermatophilaceae bacterium]